MDHNNKIKDSINNLFLNENDKYIFVYTPPKVGSTTLISSLRISLGKSYNIIHIHDEIMLSVLTGINNVNINEIIEYLNYIGKKIYVIDVYRSPIERKMSEFFEKISCYHFNNSDENISKYNIKRISDRFNKLFPHLENGDHYLEKYNISEPVLFDFDKKYTIQEINNIKYIKLRLCDSNIWANILSTIFESDIVLITDYQTKEKKIGRLYNKFKSEYKLPLNFFEEIKTNKYFLYYYSDKERNDYINLWQKKLCDSVIAYTEEEYKFYVNLYLENQYINDIQIEHYIDNGCFCKFCSLKRKDIFFRAKNGEKNFEKIIHTEVINNEIQNINKKIKKLIENNSINRQKSTNKNIIKSGFINNFKKK
jgi:hypothetical protein